MRNASFATVATVTGQAIGFGCALAGACDIVVADERAAFQLPELGRDIVPTIAMHALSPRIDSNRLKYLTFTGDVVRGAQAQALGLADLLVPSDGMGAYVEKLASRLQGMSADTISSVRSFAVSGEQGAETAVPYAMALFAATNAR